MPRPRPQRRPVTCSATGDPTMDLTINEERWKQQVRSGKIRNVTAEDAGQLIKVRTGMQQPYHAARTSNAGGMDAP